MTFKLKGIRGGTRIPVELPVQIRWKSQEGVEQSAQGKTGNISGNGLFILAPVRLRHDTLISFTVVLPVEITHIPMQLQCEGRVISHHRIGVTAGLGVVIDDYRLAAMGRPV